MYEVFWVACGIIEYIAARWIDLINDVPDVIWSAIVASAITLFGVVLSDRNNTRRQARQLSHDMSEKAKDRISVIRRETYMVAAEESAQVPMHLMSIPQMDPAKENISNRLRNFFAASAKAQLISEPGTSRLINDHMALVGETMLRLMVAAMPIHDAQIDLDLADEYFEKHSSEAERILTEMRLINESANPDLARLNALSKSLETERGGMSSEHADRMSAHKRRQEALLAFNATSTTEIINLARLQIDVSVAIRGELGIENDIEDFERQLASNVERMTRSVDTAIKALNDANGRQ